MIDPNVAPHERRLLLLSGFMGVGKSTLGRLLADRVGAELEDLDEAIEAEAGLSIPRLFAERGEAAFRRLERAVLESRLALDAGPARVIALGGGALLDPRSRARALERAFLVTLHAEVPTLLARCRDGDRPLLVGTAARAGELGERIERLLAERADAYRAGHLHLATDGLLPDALAERVAAAWRPR